MNILVGSNSTRVEIGSALGPENNKFYEEIENTVQCDLIIKYNKKVIRRVDSEDQLNNDVQERMVRGDDDEGDDDEGGDVEGGDDEEEEHLELEVEGQDKAAAYSSHCAPTFILLNILCPDLYCSTFCAYIYIAKHFVPRFILFNISSLHFVPRFLLVNILHQVFL